MRYLRKKRGLAALGALAAVIGVTLWVVLPALASSLSTGYTGTAQPPQSDKNIMPVLFNTGGQPNDCSLFAAYEPTPNPATDSYLVKNINSVSGKWITVTALDGKTVKIRETEDPTKTYATFEIQGGIVYDVGIDGGAGTSWYNYTGQTSWTDSSGTTTNQNYGGVAHDGNLHTTLKSSGPYNLSQTTLCYAPSGLVSGTVYEDLNQNGSYDSGSDTPQAGWVVSLYEGSSTTPVKTATSGSDGSYTIGVAFNPSDTYTICESPPSSDTTTWAQTEPRPTSATCSPIGGSTLPNGDTFTPSTSTDTVTQNFGNVPAESCQPLMQSTSGDLVVALRPGCKTNTYAFNSGTDPSTNKPFVSILAGDPTQQGVPSVEQVTFADPIVNGQPTYTGLEYADTFPVTSYKDLQVCKVDPRNPAATGYDSTVPDDLKLDGTYQTYGSVGSGTGSDLVLPSGETSCLIASTITAPAPSSPQSTTGTLVAYVYSLVDLQFGAK